MRLIEEGARVGRNCNSIHDYFFLMRFRLKSVKILRIAMGGRRRSFLGMGHLPEYCRLPAIRKFRPIEIF